MQWDLVINTILVIEGQFNGERLLFSDNILLSYLHTVFYFFKIMVKPSQNQNQEELKKHKNWLQSNKKEKASVYLEQQMERRNLAQWLVCNNYAS